MQINSGRLKSRLPLKEIDARNKRRIRELNGEFLNLYRVLGHHSTLLSAWIEFAYTLRRDCTTARTLRELMILRGAQLAGSAYEWHQHRRWARQQGVPADPGHESVLRALQVRVDEVNGRLASFETVKYFRVLPEPVSVENGILTASLKVKRRVVEERYAKLIEEMYRGSD